MNIYPAIDLLDGACVRLYQGRYDQVTPYVIHPIELAKSFVQQGANDLHIVDLDGAKLGQPVNLALIQQIQHTTDLTIQMGGGIRNKKQITEIFASGIARVVLGSIAISQPALVKEWIQEFGSERFVLAFDVRLNESNVPQLALHGWQTRSEISLWQILDEYQASSLQYVLCTDINRDGTLQGPNVDLYAECVKRYSNIAFQASGGISTLENLRELATIPVASAVVGKALYEQNFSLPQALEELSLC